MNVDDICDIIKQIWKQETHSNQSVKFLSDPDLEKKGKPETAFAIMNKEEDKPSTKVRYCYDPNKKIFYFHELHATLTSLKKRMPNNFPEIVLAKEPFLFLEWIEGKPLASLHRKDALVEMAKFHAQLSLQTTGKLDPNLEMKNLQEIITSLYCIPKIENEKLYKLEKSVTKGLTKLCRESKNIHYCIDSKDIRVRNFVHRNNNLVLIDLEKIRPYWQGDILMYQRSENLTTDEFNEYLGIFENINPQHASWFQEHQDILELRHAVLKLNILKYLYKDGTFVREESYVNKILRVLDDITQ